MINVTDPITLSMPVRSNSRAELLAEPRVAVCPSGGRKGRVEAVCRYASERNVTLSLVCDGTRPSMSYRCPVLPRCVFWNASDQEWGLRGCISMAMASPSSRTLSCLVNQLTTFSAVADSVAMATTTLALAPLEPIIPVKSYGLVMAGENA